MAIQLCVDLKGAYKLPGTDKIDPYAKFTFGDKALQSDVKSKTSDPQWDNATFEFKVDDIMAKLAVEIYDKKIIGSDNLIAKCAIPINRYRKLGVVDKTYELVDKEGDNAQCVIHLLIQLKEEGAQRDRELLMEMRQNQGSMRDLTLKVKQESEERENLQRQLSHLKKTKDEMEQTIADLTNEKDELDASNKKLVTENEKIKGELAELSSGTVARADYDTLQKENETLFQDLESKDAEIGELKEENQKQTQKNCELTTSFDGLRKDHENLLGDLNTESNSSLEENYAQLQEKFATLKNNNQKTENENQRVNESLHKLAEEYQELQHELKSLQQRQRGAPNPEKLSQPESVSSGVISLVADGAIDAAMGFI